MNSLPDFIRNDKSRRELGFLSLNTDLFLVIILILVATASFGLGRLSYKDNVKRELMVGNIDLNSVPASVYSATQKTESLGTEQTSQGDGSVVASKNGTKYHYPWCAGAKQISPANMIYFKSIEEARTAGYSPASNCKGLE